MSVFLSDYYDEHEQVMFCSDIFSGLRAIIAIHSTALGPAVGGCRIWDYSTDEEALSDVLRLSRGMSFKNALAKLDFGGAKSVIIGDPQQIKTPELLRAYGHFVDSLNGRYITGEDVGLSVDDVEHVANVTPYVAGRAQGTYASGDPAPFTAHGVYVGMKAALQYKLGTDRFDGLTVAVQGLGHVGYRLCERLVNNNARLVVSDIREDRVRRAVDAFGARAVSSDAIIEEKVEIFAPCALGAVINDNTVERLETKIVAGAANNQLAEARHAELLRERDILFAPDYVINAGGIMNAATEIVGEEYSRSGAMDKIQDIASTLVEIFEVSDRKNLSTVATADRIALERIQAAQNRSKEKTK